MLLQLSIIYLDRYKCTYNIPAIVQDGWQIGIRKTTETKRLPGTQIQRSTAASFRIAANRCTDDIIGHLISKTSATIVLVCTVPGPAAVYLYAVAYSMQYRVPQEQVFVILTPEIVSKQSHAAASHVS